MRLLVIHAGRFSVCVGRTGITVHTHPDRAWGIGRVAHSRIEVRS